MGIGSQPPQGNREFATRSVLRIFREELESKFPDFRQIAAIMYCSESTARKWAAKYKCRYILHEGKQRVFAEDVRGMTDERNAILADGTG
jgi:hypothetical protein